MDPFIPVQTSVFLIITINKVTFIIYHGYQKSYFSSVGETSYISFVKILDFKTRQEKSLYSKQMLEYQELCRQEVLRCQEKAIELLAVEEGVGDSSFDRKKLFSDYYTVSEPPDYDIKAIENI